MKRKHFLAAFPFFAALCSCAPANSDFALTDYIQTIKSDSSSLNILQLTDIHWNMTTDIAKAEAYLNNLIDVAKARASGKIDLIAVTGDSLLVASKEMAERLYSLIDSWNIPFFVTYGNHDLQGLWSGEWMNENVSAPKRKNSLYVNLADNIHGESNYVINWEKGGKTIWQIYSIDTGHYLAKNGIKYGYDYLHEDQVEWYKNQTDLAKGSATDYLPSLVFGHIPLQEVKTVSELEETRQDRERAEEAHNPYGNGTSPYIGGYAHEKDSPSFVESSFFEAMRTHGSKGMFFGHDHSNDAVYKYQNVVLGYGVKSNIELYYTDINFEGEQMTMTGGSLYTIKEDKTFDIEHIYIDYADNNKIGGWRKESL